MTKDLFSERAQDYARFRPKYPRALFDFLASQVSEKKQAWDCATGSGQAAVELARHFDHVIATDLSEKQLENATSHPKISYRVATAENSGIDDQSVNLTTVAQALHWLNLDQFYQEVRRVSRPGAVIAVWMYHLAEISPAIDAIVEKFYRETLGPYWEKERHYVDSHYQTIPFPFKNISTPEMEMSANWNLNHLIGYLNTWSPLRKYIQAHGINPLDALYPAFQQAWGDQGQGKASYEAKWKLTIRVGRI